MNRTLAAPVSAGLLLTLACTIALGLGADHQTGQPIRGQEKWPAGLADLINKTGHAGGFFVNADDYFFFCGDTKACNTFLEAYANLKDTPLQVVLHAGQTTDRRPWSKPEDKSTVIDWRVDIVNRAWRNPAGAKAGQVKPGYSATVHLWLGRLYLEQLEIPLAVKVVSGGEIEKFVAHHEAKQTLVPEQAAPAKPGSAPEAKPSQGG